MIGRAAQCQVFSQWLNEKIAALGYSNNQAAQLMHVSGTALATWREGSHLPSAASARVIAWALGVSVLEVLCHLFEVTDEDLLAEIARRGDGLVDGYHLEEG
jgi:hypothetical protein